MGANTSEKAESKTKLGVYLDRDLKRRLDHETVDADVSLRELVTRRLELSYRLHPGPLSLESIPA